LESVVVSVQESGAYLERFVDYPGNGHLFTDPTLADFDSANTELFWQRVLAFLGSQDG
jgi:hypothetical protein